VVEKGVETSGICAVVGEKKWGCEGKDVRGVVV